jgi:hypothetical protein
MALAKLDNNVCMTPHFVFNEFCKSFSIISKFCCSLHTPCPKKCVIFVNIPHLWVLVDVQDVIAKLSLFFNDFFSSSSI